MTESFKGEESGPFYHFMLQNIELHSALVSNHLCKYHLCSLFMFTCFLINTLQNCTPAAGLFSPHCTLLIKSPQHSLHRNNFVTTSFYLILFKGIQAKINCLCYIWGETDIPFLLYLYTFHIK